jgi:hypothetical protein
MIMHKSPDVGVVHDDRLPLLASQIENKSNEIPSFYSSRIMHTFVKFSAPQVNEIMLALASFGRRWLRSNGRTTDGSADSSDLSAGPG